MTVEIVEYYANAQSRKEGKFSSEGTEPKNPMLQLRIHAPDQKEPVSEIAFAKYPFMNHGSIKKQASSARFWYHHPAVKPATGVEFLQTPDGKLYCRVGDDGVYHPRGEVKEGDRIAVSADRQIALVRHIPHARPEGTFTPIELTPGETTEAEAAALVELTIGDRSERFWLGRNDVQRGRKLQTPDGPLIVLFGYERVPLGFSLKLVDFQRDKTSDSAGDASCVSHVSLSEGEQAAAVVSENDPPREISANSPLRYGAFTFYQSGWRQLPNKVDLSVLRVTSDPGRILKYSGSAMICGGILLMFCLRVLMRRPMPSLV